MFISLVITTYNEEKNIINLLSSIAHQTLLPDEVVIVDANSTDETVKRINSFCKNFTKIPIKVYILPGNRSVGRNEAVKHCAHQVIAVTDAGCYLKKDWLEKITGPFTNDESIDVVAGWYQPIAQTKWQKALTKVLNFRLEKINVKTFLPSTRSVAFKKKVFYGVGGFDEQYSYNEDTPFGLKLKKIGAKFFFQPKAIVYWTIPNNYRHLYRTVWRYAYGDGEARLWLSQYKIILAFWLLLVGFLLLFLLFFNSLFLIFLLAIFIAYLYLPFFQAKKLDNISELLTIPVLKFTMILANTTGFIKGLLTKNEI